LKAGDLNKKIVEEEEKKVGNIESMFDKLEITVIGKESKNKVMK
jgi:hypothetical protein